MTIFAPVEHDPSGGFAVVIGYEVLGGTSRSRDGTWYVHTGGISYQVVVNRDDEGELTAAATYTSSYVTRRALDRK